MIAELALPFPFELEFMQRALVACVAVGAFAPTIGVFLVQKRLSLIGDGIGHVAFAGVGAGLLGGLGAAVDRARRSRWAARSASSGSVRAGARRATSPSRSSSTRASRSASC